MFWRTSFEKEGETKDIFCDKQVFYHVTLIIVLKQNESGSPLELSTAY